ncbi:MAG: peptidylprolyl isomerase [Verrucomicrobiaceae bacterium]|nr:MAG: peptidylprolyl isomerase [Verrucomicrobiaceae bacterium]
MIDLKSDPAGLTLLKADLETEHGHVIVQFYPNEAPKTVARITELMNQGFYNGLKFHRVVPNFVAQGGDPTGTGAGGSGQKLKAEFNSRKHVPGAMAMARSGDPDSADSQFYICLNTIPHLDGAYTVFGQVTSGMEVVQKIQQDDVIKKVTLIQAP